MPVLLYRAFSLACLVLLTACVSAPAPKVPAAAPLPREPEVVQLVLDYQAWLAQQSEESLRAESLRLEQAGTARAVLEKALLRARPHDVAALEEALAVLAPLQLSTEPSARHWQPVAAVLALAWQADLQVQKQLLEQQEKLAQQLRDSQRRNEQLNDRVEQLGDKLEALKSIELNLPKPAPATRSPAP